MITKEQWSSIVERLATLRMHGHTVHHQWPGWGLDSSVVVGVDKTENSIRVVDSKGNPFIINHESFQHQRVCSGPTNYSEVHKSFFCKLTVGIDQIKVGHKPYG